MADASEIFESLKNRLDEVAKQLGVESVFIMRSTPTHMRVEAIGGAAERIYKVGAEGKKGKVFENTHELYCERVVNTNKPLFVKDAALDPEWDGNEDLAEFGMGNYLGYPIHDDRGNVFGTVGVLDNTVQDYSPQDKAIVESLRDAAEETLQTYLQRQSPP
ncbi:GAF domain-containing protein [Chroococcidiopsidales cyanobacterium LEGE 13417]|nr:GAF domain-containing protein [Chroococcidiopsidales cyanobacterium LEGE 13417]